MRAMGSQGEGRILKELFGKAVFAFAFGAPDSLASNRWIAWAALGIARKNNRAPIYTQRDVRFMPSITHPRMEVRVWRPDEVACCDRPTTLQLARFFVRQAKQEGRTQAFVVCAEPHAWRAIRDLEIAMQEEEYPMTLHLDEASYRESIHIQWYSVRSSQPCTRTARAFVLRELLLRFMPECVYRQVAA